MMDQWTNCVKFMAKMHMYHLLHGVMVALTLLWVPVEMKSTYGMSTK